jgi:hypothetical protein
MRIAGEWAVDNAANSFKANWNGQKYRFLQIDDSTTHAFPAGEGGTPGGAIPPFVIES